MGRLGTANRAALLGSSGAGAVSRQEISNLLNNLGNDSQMIPMDLTAAKSPTAWTTLVGATPTGGVLGLATTVGAPLTGATSNNTTTSDAAGFMIRLPESYTDGDSLKVRVRAKVSALRNVSSTIAASVKKIVDTVVGSELVTTAALNLTTSYADYDFVVTPTGMQAGDRLWLVVTAANNDTGGSTNGFTTISNVALVASVFG